MRQLPLIGTVLVTAVLASSCNTNGPDPLPAVNTLSISGTVVTPSTTNPSAPDTAWTGGAGTVSIALVGSTVSIAPVTLESDGTFSLNLNQEVPDSQLLAQSSLDNLKGLCDDPAAVKLVASNPSSRNVGAQVKVKTASVDQITAPALTTLIPPTTATPGSLTLAVGTIVYSNAANTLTDNQTCKLGGKDVNLKVDIRLVRGWNAIVLTSTVNIGTPGTPTLAYETKALPTRWIVFNAPPTLNP